MNHNQSKSWLLSCRYCGLAFPIIALLTIAFSARALAAPPAGRWDTDLRAARAKARESRQPMLIMFSAAWSDACNMMKQNVLTQDKVKRVLAEYVTVYVDRDEQKEITQQYDAQFLPTFVLIASDGSVLGRFVGYNSPDEFIRKLGVIRTELPALARQTTEKPNDPALWVRRARVLESLENPDSIPQVVEFYKKARALDPANRTGVAVDLAFFDAARVTSEGPEAADKRFAEFLNRYPNSPRAEDALFNRLDIALRLGNDAQAKTLLTQYQQKYPKGKFTREASQIKEMLAQPRPATPPPGTEPQDGGPSGAPPSMEPGPSPSSSDMPAVPER